MNKVHLTASRHVVEVMIAAWMGLPMTASAKEIKPTSDTQVLEKLAPRLSNSGNPALAANPQVRLAQAQEAIRLARQTSDPRHLGRAQVALAPWWDRSDAPVEAAVLQATVQQSRHEFAAAQRVLAGALTREPKPGQASLSPGSQSSGSQSPAWQSQGWLTLANLERVTGRYSASLKACDQVAAAGASLYAQACQLETRSMMGEHALARQGFTRLSLQFRDAQTQAWALSLLGESEERAGEDGAALNAYRRSLGLADDTYTALALADLLLRTAQPGPALAVLRAQPNSDAVLIRRAYAGKLLKDPSWAALHLEVSERFAALDRRGDEASLHARERALAALWLEDDATKGFKWAQTNLKVQREPADWWIAATTARLLANKSGVNQDLDKLRQTLNAQGLSDARINTLVASK